MKKMITFLLCLTALKTFAQDTTKPKQNEYLCVLTVTEKYKDEKNWTPKEQAIVGEHFKRLVKMKEEGIVVLAGRTQYETNNPDLIGLVIFFAKNDEEALKVMMEDPAVNNNIMYAKVHPYHIAVNKCQ